jgi:peptidoglycan/xylan/chitin deacetylase (PgdA/CDA1 family)
MRAACLLLLACALAGCRTAAPPPVGPPAPAAPTAAAPVLSGEVLGQSDRLVVYQPGLEDSLRSIAARFLGSAERDWVIAEFNGITRAEPGQPLAVPLKPMNAVGVQPDQYQTIPMLCYHRFGNGNGNGGSKMTVSEANFAQQLDWLAKSGFRVIRLAQLLAFLEGKEALPKRSVVITIDDGYESVHRVALPLLRKHGFPATLFVYTDFIGAGGALSWSQLQDLAASGLVDVQAHSKSHRNLIERLAGEGDAQYRQGLEAEARVPRELLERRLPVAVRHYAYPYGDANEQVLEVLTQQHFQLGVTVNPGGNAFFAQPLMLRRTMIFGDHDLEAFKARLQTQRPVAAAAVTP